MENLVCAVGVKSGPDDMRDGVFAIITDILTWACEWDRSHTYRSESVHESKLNFYALLRQDCYNACLINLETLDKLHNSHNLQRDKVVARLRVLASVKIEVLMKVTETCMAARRNFLEREAARTREKASSEESSGRADDPMSSQLSDKMVSDMVLDGEQKPALDHQTTSKEPDVYEPADNGKSAAEDGDQHRQEATSEQRLVVALDNWNKFVEEEQRKRRIQVGKWLWAYGKPPAGSVPAKHGRNHST